MMDKELATLLDATSFQVADLVGPAIVIEGAANHLLSRLPETDEHRWKVTEALGSIVAARKSWESAADALLHIVAQDGADMLAVEVDGGALVDRRDRVVLADNLELGRTFKRHHPMFAEWQVITPQSTNNLRGRSITEWVEAPDFGRVPQSDAFRDLWSLATLTATEVDTAGQPKASQCRSLHVAEGDNLTDLPRRCRQDADHLDEHWDNEMSWV